LQYVSAISQLKLNIGWRPLVVLTALALAMAGAACGSSSEDETGESPNVSRAAFIKRADVICEKSTYKMVEEREAFERERGIPVNRPNTAQQEEEFAEVMAPSVVERVEELEELQPPAGDEARLQRIFDAFRGAAERVERNPSLQDGYPNIYTPVKKLTQAYGFVACGTG
jgi:hypothetical protein